MDTMRYMGAIPPNLAESDLSSLRDEADYSTLKRVQKMIDDEIFKLKEDFNAFSVFSDADPDIAARNMLVDVRSRQQTYVFLSNVKASVDGAIGRVDSKNTKR